MASDIKLVFYSKILTVLNVAVFCRQMLLCQLGTSSLSLKLEAACLFFPKRRFLTELQD